MEPWLPYSYYKAINITGKMVQFFGKNFPKNYEETMSLNFLKMNTIIFFLKRHSLTTSAFVY